MLVIEKAKALALKLNNPQQVLECIPTAKELTIKGNTFVAVPHKPDEVRVLRNLGIKAPAPILHTMVSPVSSPPSITRSRPVPSLP